jgi:hypothetical protein
MVDLTKKANLFLKHYFNTATPLWKVGVTEAYVGTEGATHAIELTQKKVNKLGLDSANLRVVGGGPRHLAKKYFTEIDESPEKCLPSEIEQIIEILKQSNGIMQIGGGHGRATLFNLEGLIDSYEANKTTLLTVHKSDVGGLADAMISAIARQQDDITVLRKENQEYQDEIARLQSEVGNLRSEVAIYSSATWA